MARHMISTSSWNRPGTKLRLAGIIALAALSVPPSAGARQGDPPRSWQRDQVLPLETFEPLRLAAVDRERLLAETATPKDGGGPLPFAVAREVSISPSTHGIWESLDDGGQLWRYRVEVPGATDLSFAFATFWLPAGATVHVLAEDEAYFEGPYTAEDHDAHGQLWTPVIPGAKAVLELYVPVAAELPPELLITRVHAGFRDLFKRLPEPKQGSCNIDVVCPQGGPWRDQIRAVARYAIQGVGLCTGTLIADVPHSGTPFFVTADHCGLTTATAPSVVVYWNYESAACGDLSGGSLSDNQSGAIFRASRPDPDMALIELDDVPRAASAVFFAGWDRTGAVPATSVAIHHPSADEKAISLNDDPLTVGRNCIVGGNTGDTHWYVDDWDQGTTEPGSSGSGLFHGGSKRLIGFLSGGSASCANTSGFDCFGRFASSWDGPSPSERLRDWLDPGSTGRSRVDGFDPGGVPTCPENAGSGRYCSTPGCAPCGHGEGDCDADAECAPGLTCVDNIGAQFGFAPGIDVCVGGTPPPPGCDPSDLGTGRYCTACGPCGEGEGDCDSDAECAAGLHCVDNVGANYGFAPGIDVCVGNPTCSEDLGTGRYCTECGPCGEGQGDCDSDAECAAGLHCVDDIGAQFGFAPGVDVCVGGAP